MYMTKKLSDFVAEFNETDEDFVACHYINEFDGNKESLVRFIIQDKRKPKLKEFLDEKQKMRYYWPGVSPAKMVSVIKTYTKGQRYSEFFHCVYRLRHTEGLEDKIKELIPEGNRESV